MTAPFLSPPPLNFRKPENEDAQLQKVLESNGKKEKTEEVRQRGSMVLGCGLCGLNCLLTSIIKLDRE